MGDSPSYPPGTVHVRCPVSQIPLRLRNAHPHAFYPHTLCLGPGHLDDDWNGSLHLKTHAVFASLSKPDSGFKPKELWMSITLRLLQEDEAVSTILERKFVNLEFKEEDAEIQTMAQILNRLIELLGDSVFLVSSFLADLHASPETMRGKYGVAAIHDAAKLVNQLPVDLLQAVVVGLPSALDKAAFQERKDDEDEAKILAAMLRAPFAASEFPKVVRSFCRFYSPFPHAELSNFDLRRKKSLLDCLHASVSGEFEFRETATDTARPETVERDGPTAKEMVQAGIRFEPGQAKSIAEIRFEDGVLRLPALVLSDITETVLRNLMVLEVSYKENPVSEYVWLLKGMAGSGGDVAVLREAGVLRGYHGKNERVAKLIKSMDDSYFFCPYYFSPIRKAWEDLKSYCDQKRKEANVIQATPSAVTGTADERKEPVRADSLAVSGKAADEGKEAGRVDGLAVSGKAAGEGKEAGCVNDLTVPEMADEGKEAGLVDGLAVSGKAADEGKEAGCVNGLTVPEMADERK